MAGWPFSTMLDARPGSSLLRLKCREAVRQIGFSDWRRCDTGQAVAVSRLTRCTVPVPRPSSCDALLNSIKELQDQGITFEELRWHPARSGSFDAGHPSRYQGQHWGQAARRLSRRNHHRGARRAPSCRGNSSCSIRALCACSADVLLHRAKPPHAADMLLLGAPLRLLVGRLFGGAAS